MVLFICTYFVPGSQTKTVKHGLRDCVKTSHDKKNEIICDFDGVFKLLYHEKTILALCPLINSLDCMDTPTKRIIEPEFTSKWRGKGSGRNIMHRHILG
jgi:hypothetical protein